MTKANIIIGSGPEAPVRCSGDPSLTRRLWFTHDSRGREAWDNVS